MAYRYPYMNFTTIACATSDEDTGMPWDVAHAIVVTSYMNMSYDVAHAIVVTSYMDMSSAVAHAIVVTSYMDISSMSPQ
jgi:hypothetical protein